jgi:predicted Zn-ribbon and HTH transcriptional regulator
MDEKVKCKVCGYEWTPRAKDPKQCPKCKRYDWKEEEVKKDD